MIGARARRVEDPVLRLWAARVVVLVGVLILGGLLTALLSYLLDQTGLTGITSGNWRFRPLTAESAAP